MKRFLFFLLFILFSLSLELKTIKVPIKTNITCKGGKIMNNVCKCPNGKKLIKGECKIEALKCIGGKLESGKCKCPGGNLLYEGECLNRTTCPARSIKEGNTCKRCRYKEISWNNTCVYCGKFSTVVGNKCKYYY